MNIGERMNPRDAIETPFKHRLQAAWAALKGRPVVAFCVLESFGFISTEQHKGRFVIVNNFFKSTYLGERQ